MGKISGYLFRFFYVFFTRVLFRKKKEIRLPFRDFIKIVQENKMETAPVAVTTPAGKIFKEEFQKAFPTMAEEAVELIIATLGEKIAPRLAKEADKTSFKMVGQAIATAYPLLKGPIAQATDFNKDGQ